MKATQAFPTIEPLESRIAPALAANIFVGSLDGKAGFGAFSTADREVVGSAVSSAGDVNGDGFDDVIVAGYGTSVPTSAGATYVIFGKANGFAKSLTLGALNGTDGFKITGAAQGDYSGRSVAAAGDVNGDGFDDIIIGASGRRPDGTFQTGAAYVVFGKASGFPATLSLGTLNGTDGFAMIGRTLPEDQAGKSVSGAGDINGDGFDDVIVGTLGRGAYVVFGKAGGFASSLSLPSLTATDGFKIVGPALDTGFGARVAGAGDVNGDGVSDMVVSAPYGVHRAGTAYVIFGNNTTPFGTTFDTSTLTGTNGFIVNGVQGDYAGITVGTAGDVNGDGHDDLIVGSRGVSSSTGIHGRVHVIYGKTTTFANAIDLATLDGTSGFRLDNEPSYPDGHEDGFGRVAAGAGDVNGDGFGDIIIGRQGAFDGGNGQAYVVYGRSDFPAAQFITQATLNGSNGITLNSTVKNGVLGVSARGAGDVNNDGFADLIVGAPGINADNRGAAFVVFGGPAVTLSADGRTATMFESDGDLITVKTTKGSFQRSDFTLDSGVLQKIDLTRDIAGFSGTSITVSATTPAGGTGDGEVALGALIATGIDLGAVTIDGDLGQLDAGNGTFATPGAGVISVYSLGRLGLATQAAGGSLQSDIGGGFAALNVLTAIVGASVNAVGGPIGTIKVGGGVTAATIGAGTTLGVITVDGDLAGTTITAVGNAAPATAAAALAIKSLTVGGNVDGSLVLAGYNFAGEAKNPDVQIGAVKVDGMWIASTIASGATSGTDLKFGTPDDALVAANGAFTDQALKSRIGSITIAAGVLGTNDPATDQFGFVAEEIGGFKVGITAFPLTSDRDSLAVGATGDVNIFELGAIAPPTPPTPPGLVVDAAGKSATFTDVDGDRVTVKSSKGGLSAVMFQLTNSGTVGGQQLERLDLTSLGTAAGSDITISAKRSEAGGDGFIHIGFLDATGVDLGKVTIGGDLGRIRAGDADPAKPAVKALGVFSIGRYGTSTQAAGGSNASDFDGALGALTVRTDIFEAELSSSGSIGTVKIDGSLVTGRIATDSTLGAVTVGGNLSAFDLVALGTVAPANAGKAVAIKSLKIGGNVDGSNILAGYNRAGVASNEDASIGTVAVAGDWNESNLIAGFKDGTSDGFGRNDVLIANVGAVSAIISKIAGVTINGNATGSADPGKHFGIVAEQIGKLSVSGVKRIFTKAPNDILLDPVNGNLRAIDLA